MDPDSMHERLTALLTDVEEMLKRLEAHQAKLLTHHPSRERDHALAQAKGAIRRHEKTRRRIQRAIKVQP